MISLNTNVNDVFAIPVRYISRSDVLDYLYSTGFNFF